jgi:O-antigen ligase
MMGRMAKKIKDVPDKTWQFSLLEYLSYGLVFVVPLYINSAHWMTISMPKQLLFIGTICVMVGFYIWGKWASGDNQFTFTKIHGGLLGFFVVLTISALLGVDPKNSFFGTWQSNLNLITFYALGIFGLFMGFLMRRNHLFLPKIGVVILVSGVITAGITYFGRYVINFSNDGSTIGNNSYLGAYLLLVVCTSIGILFWYQKYWQKFLIGIGILSILISPVFLNRMIWSGGISFSQVVDKPFILLGGANGAAVGIGLAIVVMTCLWLTRTKNVITKVAGGICFACLVLGIWIGGSIFMNPESQIHRSFVAEKTENRFIFWNVARDGFAEKPLLGYGFNNYSYIYQKYLTPQIFRNEGGLEVWVSRPHNIFLEYLSVSGILGILAFATSIGGLFLVLYKKSADEDRRKKIFGIVFAGALFGYTFQNLFVFDTLVPLMLFFVAVGAAISFSKEYFTPQIGSVSKKVVLGMIGVGSIMVFIVMVVLPWRESVRWGKLAGDIPVFRLAELRQGAQDMSVVGTIEDTAYIMDREIIKINDAIPSIADKDKPVLIMEIDSLIANLEQEMNKNSDVYRAHLTMVNLIALRLMLTSDHQETLVPQALNYFKEAIRLSPANPMIYINMANLYTVIGNSSEAYKYLRASIAMAPTFKDGYAAAKNIIMVMPNKKLERYIITMEKHWIK